MKKPYGRQTRKKVGKILTESGRSSAMEKLKQIPDEQLVGHLFSHFYHKSETVKFRSIAAMGLLVARIEEKKKEKARIILRRIMWNLNDESGGIGWGSPEAMGEILYHCPELALEFKSIIFSYLDPGGNYIEHEVLQRGVIWGIGTYFEACPSDINKKTKLMLYGYLHSDDPIKRGYALRALINANSFDCRMVPESIATDPNVVKIFTGWNFVSTRISDMALACQNHKIFA